MLHAFLIIFFLIASLYWGDWRKWRSFLPTIYYFSLCNLFYQYIAFVLDKKLWELKKPIYNLFLTDTIYAFVAYPAFVIWFLSNEREDAPLKHRVLRYGRWVSISLLVEYVFIKLNYIELMNGWNIGWEVFFYSTMYPMVALHHRRPLLAIILSSVMIVFYLIMFNYPIFKK
ncbi:hypothetical protein CIB95_11995 [Lottiidibacillus patelloidae]|uniref:Uncharacterized protein n=1 Tax=Lottiidibacillus patelloidae TaxID=2670334 RepID=A0A263BRZ4_9BACI|nr:CBO0543 family protein [Lottiidibacillus patelloidae]OZM56491.1 hypothetical protein CIB95_11995 [Lottiidibacillus patelloidae]